MKIGELAQACKVPVGTIRYYISTGLLVPEHSGAQYTFTDREYRDLQLILKLKQQQFNLKEIQSYLSLIRHSNFIERDTIDACIQMMQRKKQELSEEIFLLNRSIADIDQEIKELESITEPAASQTGVPLCALSLFVCPHCGRPLLISDARIQNQFLLSGTLSCPPSAECPGYKAVIENGIIKTGKLYTGIYDKPDLTRGMYRAMGQEFSTDLQKCYDNTASELKNYDLHGKTLLEANINGYFFLYNHLKLIPEDCLCIVVDKYPEILEMYKSLIERLNLNRQILYLADASTDYPLKRQSIDFHISYLSENEYQLYHKNCYLADAGKYLRPDARLIGVFLSYDKNAVSRKKLKIKYPECSDRCYQVDYLKEDYKKLNCRINLTEIGIAHGHERREYAFECHVKEEPLCIFHFTASFGQNKK